MRRKLVIAEKPSVAATIAGVLKATSRGDGFYENERWIVSWCVGHLVELKDAAEYDQRYRRWDIANLPIMPSPWGYKAVESTRKQLTILHRLMAREDVGSLVCATDAGREGEAIFRRVYEICRCRKPVERLWVSSLEEKGIRKAFAEMRSDSEYDNLFKAADARNKADWLVGINATILYTLRFSDRSVYSVGRVQTPTLRMVADRDAEIGKFTPKPLYAVVCNLESDGVEWQLATRKFEDRKEAEKALAQVRSTAPQIVSVERSEVRKWPQPLYCLNDLQRDASRLHGFTPDRTLSVLQQLYERKLTTYPRTDSRHLTSDMEGPFASLAGRLRRMFGLDATCTFRPVRVCIDDAKVSDHHAILVTETYLRKLDEGERFGADEEAILSLIAGRMMSAISTPLVLSETKVLATSGDVELAATGSEVTSPGFLAVERVMLPHLAARRKGFASLPSGIKEGPTSPKSTGIVEGQTSPPKPYTDDTLLLAMEKAGTKEMDKDVERKGIGTSATRAAIIKRLETVGYITRAKGKGKATMLHATEKGRRLLEVVPEALSSPELTAEWENRLLRIERGEYDADVFEKEIRDYVASFVRIEGKDIPSRGGGGDGKVVGTCPKCGGEVRFDGRVASCACGKCRIWAKGKKVFRLGKEVDLGEDEVRKLLSDGFVEVTVAARRGGRTVRHVVKFAVTGYKDNGWATMSVEVLD